MNMRLMMIDPTQPLAFTNSKKWKSHPHSVSFLKNLPAISQNANRVNLWIFKPLDKRKLIFDLLFSAVMQPAVFKS